MNNSSDSTPKRRHLLTSWRPFILTALIGLNAVIPSQTAAADKTNWLTEFQADIKAAAQLTPPGKNRGGKIAFVHGNNLWQPGHEYRSGNNWLALICGSSGCRLEAARLQVKKAKWQGHYDDTPTQGQQLRFTLAQPSNDKVIAWFEQGKPAASPQWLIPGPVTSYFNGLHPAKTTAPGNFEAEIPLPGKQTLRLVPLISRGDSSTSSDNPSYQPYSASLFLQLRLGKQRQMLLGDLYRCTRKISDTSYLLWAGDLDGDSRPDLLISFVDADGPVHLYLSSAAKPGQLVGLAGVHVAPPNGGECDGDGWEGLLGY
jgi:hypothetical protein